jgi:hypothetical protein
MIIIKVIGLRVGEKTRKLLPDEVNDVAARVKRLIKQSRYEAKVSVKGNKITISNLSAPDGVRKNPLNKKRRAAFMKKLSQHFAYYLGNLIVAMKEE